MSREFPDVIDLVEAAPGSFIPGVVQTPTTGAIVPYRPATPAVYQAPLPASPPRYQSGSRGLTDDDLADFGTDAFGRPVVTRDPITGRAQFNPEVDYEGPRFEGRQRRQDFIDSLPDSRSARFDFGKALDLIDRAGNAADLARFFDDVQDLTGVHPIPSFGYVNDFWDAVARSVRSPQGVPSGKVNSASIRAGYCPTTYEVKYRYTDSGGIGPAGNGEKTVQLLGPIHGFDWKPFRTNQIEIGIRHGPSQTFYITATSFTSFEQTGPYFTSFERLDGEPDNCLGEPTATPTAPTGTQPTTDYPPEVPQPEYPDGPRLPNAPGDYESPELPDPEYRDLPELPELPEPENRDDTDPPTPEPDCCPSTERSLDAIKLDLQQILEKLQGNGAGAFDLTPCGEESTIEAEYEGNGLTGIYSALSAIEQSLNFIAGNTKCPPDVELALPMAFEVKRGEIPQLVVSWRKLEGSDSKWSMNIPHPNELVNADYAFDFPTYRKGATTCTLRLTDNSYLIVNAANEAEGSKVIDYCLTLIDSAFIPTERRITITQNAADYQEVDVKAVHVKAFLGHKNTAPLWAKRLTS